MSRLLWGFEPGWRSRLFSGSAPSRAVCVLLAGIAVSGGVAGCSESVSHDAPGPVSCPSDAPTFSVQFAEVTGRLSKNGLGWDPLPELQFVLRDGSDDEHRTGRSAVATGDGTFTASLPHGTYDARLFMGATHIVNGLVPQGVEVDGPLHLDLGFETVLVTGEVLLAGGAFPAEETNRGRVCLWEKAGERSSFCAEPSGPVARFSLEVPRGRVYELGWVRGGRVASDAPLNDIPYGQQSFALRAFDEDTVVDLDVNAPSVVLTGRVSSDGSLISELTPRPVGIVQVGPVEVDMAEQGESTFQVRLLSGSYDSIVYVVGATGAIRVLQPCPKLGCILSEDAEWSLDVLTPPTGVVEGTIDFVDLAGEPLPASAVGGGGELRFDLLPEPSTTPVPHAAINSYSASVDAAHQFRCEGVPFGTYSVSYRRGDTAPGPLGIFRFDGVLVVDRAQIAWRQSATVVPAVIDVTVNGRPMPDDSRLEGEPRGVLLFSEAGRGEPADPDAIRLELGETGPTRFERSMLKGRYETAVTAQTSLGRTYLRGLEQDVLPIGQLDLGVVELGTASNPREPATLSFDLPVQDVTLSVQHTELLSTSAASPITMVSLTSEEGRHPFWIHPSAVGAEVSLRVYAGCYAVAALPTDFPEYPNTDAHEREVPVGRLCTCDTN